jgi:hypothetical protein
MHKGVRQVIVHFRVSGFKTQRSLVFGNGLREEARRPRQAIRQVVVGFRAIGLKAHRFPVLGDGLGQPAGDAR